MLQKSEQLRLLLLFVCLYSFRQQTATDLRTSGVTAIMVGNAIINANTQAFNQTVIIPSIMPTLKIDITKDMMLDMSSDIKNENT